MIGNLFFLEVSRLIRKVLSESEWDAFPSAHFVVPSFQLSITNGKTAISINLVTESNDAAEQFEKLRDERDRLNPYRTSRGVRSAYQAGSCINRGTCERIIIWKQLLMSQRKLIMVKQKKLLLHVR